MGQTYPNLEVIVIDDGSTRYQEKLGPYMRYIHYIGKANGGTASALNYGMQLASGKYVAWLSSDDRFMPDKVARQVAFMENMNAQVSHTDFEVMDEYGRITETRAAIKFHSAKAFIAAMLNYCPVNGCTVMMTRDLISKIGWFNESLPFTHDYDLWMRIVLSRVDFHYMNESLTLYRRHSQMGTARHMGQIIMEAGHTSANYRLALEQLVALLPG